MLRSGLSISNPIWCELQIVYVFFLNLFCHEVNNCHVPHEVKTVMYLTTKRTQTKPYTIGSSHQLRLEVKRLEWSTTFSFFHYFTPLKHQMENLRFLGDFFQPPYCRTGNTLIRFPFQSSSSVYEVSYPCHLDKYYHATTSLAKA